MIFIPREEIVLPELEEPVCCRNSSSDTKKQPSESWQRMADVANITIDQGARQ